MTDEQIVKALEWHSNDETHCSACPYEEHSVTHYCVDMVMKDALDLINRKKAEIERLKNAYKQCTWERDIFAEDMKEEIKKDCSYLALDINTIKAEAVKELLEKLTKEYGHYTLDTEICIDAIFCSIKHIVKEMVGKN